MLKTLKARQILADGFQASRKSPVSVFGSKDKYALFYTEKFLIQDQAESLDEHRIRGFNSDPHAAILELHGILQSVIIIQDTIGAFCDEFLAKNKTAKSLTGAWKELRNLRNFFVWSSNCWKTWCLTIIRPKEPNQLSVNVFRVFRSQRGEPTTLQSSHLGRPFQTRQSH